MPKFQQEYLSEYSVDQLYNLVIDVEKYPEFLPWCKAAQITEETDHEIIADLIISYKAFTEHYRSRILLTPPDIKNLKAEVKVSSIQGPFQYLHNEWRFEKAGNQTKIYFYVDFEFRSALLRTLIGLFFSKACEQMIAAFEARAGKLYDRKG